MYVIVDWMTGDIIGRTDDLEKARRWERHAVNCGANVLWSWGMLYE